MRLMEEESQSQSDFQNYQYHVSTESENSTEYPYSPGLVTSSQTFSAISQNEQIPTPASTQRKRGRPSKEATAPSKSKRAGEKREWADNETSSLINFWRDEECLYNSKCEAFSDRDERNKAVGRISEKLEELGISATTSQILEKLTSLRSYYSGQRGKERSSQSSGSGSAQVFVSAWKFMKDLIFLEDNYVPRKTVSNIGVKQTFTKTPENGKQKQDSQVLETLEKSNTMMDFAINRLTRPKSPVQQLNVQKTPDEIFGDMVSAMLKEIENPRAKDFAKLEINKILINAKYEG